MTITHSGNTKEKIPIDRICNFKDIIETVTFMGLIYDVLFGDNDALWTVLLYCNSIITGGRNY